MVEFIRSKRTSFVNKPVGVVAADTGARQLGLSVAEFGNSMQKIFWREAEKEAIVKFMTKADFKITQLKAPIILEDLKTV